MTYEMTCINCPLGCNLYVDVDEEHILVTGNTCNRGITYAKQEVMNPMRTVTSTVRVKNREIVVPVKTEQPIPKDKMKECMKEIKQIELEEMPSHHQVIIPDVCNTKVAVIVSGDCSYQRE